MLVSVNRVTLAFGCLKSAGSLSMLISLPTVPRWRCCRSWSSLYRGERPASKRSPWRSAALLWRERSKVLRARGETKSPPSLRKWFRWFRSLFAVRLTETNLQRFRQVSRGFGVLI